MVYTSIQDYIASLPNDRKAPFVRLLDVVRSNIPKGFKEQINSNMVGFVVPKSIYPRGYHCNSKLPLPFINIGNKKSYITLHHLGLYTNRDLLHWFIEEYEKVCKYKLDMGKGCMRFKRMDDIPFDLIGELVGKISVTDWISSYENSLRG